jgi:hypothetical protein
MINECPAGSNELRKEGQRQIYMKDHGARKPRGKPKRI